MHISEICTRDVVTCSRDTGIRELAALMRDRRVGDVVVVDEDEHGRLPVGIVTDRDLVVQILARRVDPELLMAADIMSEAPTTALASEAVHDAVWHMRGHGIRRLPVVDTHGALLGIVTADDLAAALAADLGEVARIAARQAHGDAQARVPGAA